MRPATKLVAAATCAFMLGTMIAPRPAYADFDAAAVVAAIGALEKAIGVGLTSVQNVLNSTLDIMNTTLGSGFSQISNYLKAQVGAQEQIADANNMIQARLARDVRNAQLRDDHAVNRQDCLNLEGGQAAVVAVHNGTEVATALDVGQDQRTEARPGTPSWNGAAQGAQANNNHHFSLYCSDAEAQAGICTQASGTLQNADQEADSLFGPPTYTDTSDITAANDYVTTLIQPVAPAALRGTALTSIEGQSTLPKRRSYDAAISLALHIGHDIVGWHANTVTLSPAQQAEAVREGIKNTDVGSAFEATDLEINRKYSGTDWQADLQAMPSDKSVLVQIALLDAQRNWLLWQQFQLDQERALVEANRLAIEAGSNLPISPMPSPNP